MESQSPMKKYWSGKRAPEQADAWFDFYKAATKPGALDRKTKELIAVAVGSAMRCNHCVKAHIADAKREGATREELAEALMVTAFIGSGSQLFWMNEDFEKLIGDGE